MTATGQSAHTDLFLRQEWKVQLARLSLDGCKVEEDTTGEPRDDRVADAEPGVNLGGGLLVEGVPDRTEGWTFLTPPQCGNAVKGIS